MKSRAILAIMDGYGLAPAGPFNAVFQARKPALDRIFASSPTVSLKTSGLDVGLPDGQMGNSEVGHLNIGAGRIVYQDITRIDHAVETEEFFQSPALLSLIADLKASRSNLHLLGLVSDGGVHASIEHVRATLELCRRERFDRVFLHAFTDGRDTPPHSGLEFVQRVEKWMNEIGVGRVSTITGRYFAMDRDKRWDRVERAYRAICHGEGKAADSAAEAIQASYDSGVTDEFLEPVVLPAARSGGTLSPQDGVFYFNFRADRARQLTDALTSDSFAGFSAPVKISRYVTMTRYREDYSFPVVSPPQQLSDILGDLVSRAGLKQLRISETEKYPHVTFFFNGGEESPFQGEDRILIPSPKVATYDLQPEMSQPEVTDRLCEAICSEVYDFIVINFPNCDMVGHTGVLSAAVTAVEAVDNGVRRMSEAARDHGYTILLTADHGNAEEMWDESTNGPHTAHTTNVVPLALIFDSQGRKLRDGGRLADLAPTILELLELPQPALMTGQSLILK